MKLEELRQRLRATSGYHEQANTAPARKKGKRRRTRARKPGFGVALFVDFEDGDERPICRTCKKRFTPDQALAYVPSVCAGCDSYL